MPYSLHAAVVLPYVKMLGNLARLLTTAEAHCTEKEIAHEMILEARLAPDMLPFSYQIKSTAVHSLGAIEGVRQGHFSPDLSPPGKSFPALAEKVEHARVVLAALDPTEIEEFIGKPMQFAMKSWRADYTAEEFLMTFSMPNFYFHAATAYDILRNQGLAIGKVDYLGRLALRKIDTL